MTATPVQVYRWRQLRLSRGWEPVQLIGRMKILADRDGVQLPKTYLLIRLVFLWEHGRAVVPGYYAGLLSRIFDGPNPFTGGRVCHITVRGRTSGR